VAPDDTPTPAPPRLALVGAASLLGKEIKDQLAASGFPGTALALLDFEEVAGVLTEYGDEARVFADTVAERVLRHELACFCGNREQAAGHLEGLLAADGLGLDCTGAWLADPRAFAWIPGVTATPRLHKQRAIVIPPASALLLGGTVAALGELVERASINVFLPATERGDAGFEELSQQSTAVLNLLAVDETVFGRQQAFDMWLPSAEHPLSAASLGATLDRLGLPVPALEVVSAPVFHGMALSMFVAGAGGDTVRDALEGGGIDVLEATAARDEADSPVRIVGRGGLRAVAVREEARGAWVWLVTDNLHTRAAAAVAAIHTLLGVPVGDVLQ
jgi:aspartate-semialdehyde dehydrogenase